MVGREEKVENTVLFCIKVAPAITTPECAEHFVQAAHRRSFKIETNEVKKLLCLLHYL